MNPSARPETEVIGRSENDDAASAVRSLEPLFRPRSVAVVGASRSPGTIGYEIVHNLVTHGFTGAVYPVNPNATAVHGVPAYPSIADVPAHIDLAVIAVPKQAALDVVDECGHCGVHAVIVISAGFREVGGAGVERERLLLERARAHGMRLVGPNCLGVLSTEPDIRMNATFAPATPPAGAVSFMSQSGAMGVTMLDYAAEYGIGIRHFVSVGNKADVSGNDLIEYWNADPGTRVILMYLESFGNPRKFPRIAREATRRTPIIAVKSGRTAAGARAASSHTGALAGTDAAIDALLAQCGVIRVDTVAELFDCAMAFSHLPVPSGPSVAIVTNAGGPGIIIADACEGAGLDVATLSDATQARLRRDLPEEASVRNPVDMIATANAENYRLALDAVLDDDNVAAAIAAFVPPLGVRQVDVASAIVAARAGHPDKPVLAVLMGREGLPEGRADLNEAGIPAYIFPESAARALAALDRYRAWRQRPLGSVARFDVDRNTADSLIRHAETTRDAEYMPAADARALLAAYGIPVVMPVPARTADEAAAAARDAGFPVVLKIASPDIIHKTEVGGVVLDLRDDDEVRAAFDAMLDRARRELPDARIDGVTVEPFVLGGRETILGMTWDAAFGPILMFGLGGIYVEAMRDVVFRVHPVTDVDADEMVRAIRTVRLLEGVRGEPPSDFDALVDAIQRLSQLVGEQPAIREIDVNPFVVFERGAIAVDARVRVGRAHARVSNFPTTP